MFEKDFNHKILNSKEKVNILGLNKKIQASYVWNLFSESKNNILIVTNTLYDANFLYKSLQLYDESSVLFFPMDDFIVSEALAISPDLMMIRIETLNELSISKNKKIIITNLMGYLRFLPSKKLWKELKINIKINDVFKRSELIKKLNIMGYKKENLVTKTGEYANRGYILDIFPYGYDNPIRLEFFDDEVEKMRNFNPDSQLSINNQNDIEIMPFTEFVNERLINDIPQRQSLLPRVVNNVESITNYVDNPLLVYVDENDLKLSYKNIMNEVSEFKLTDNFKISDYMHDITNLIPNKYLNIISLDNYSKNLINIENYYSNEIESFNGDFIKLNNFLLKLKKLGKIIIVCLDNNNMISDFMNRINVKSIITSGEQISNDFINVIKMKMPNGFILNDKVYITSNEIYKKQEAVKYKSKFRYGAKIKDINKLSVGDYVVHASHGIGKYLGLVTLTSRKMKKDYLHIEYKDGDKLYIPVEKIEFLSKYSSNEGIKPKLNKLGGTDWVKQKARVRGKIHDIAKELLKTSAKRKLIPGFAFYADDKDQYNFERKFPYVETKDQLGAIIEIKKDMESSNPMDRLLCGDVGYGKTEVAFRAIFKAIKSGKQVAFLCPTTILSKQHYENAINRFDGFGINIEVLNRFVSTKHKEEVLKNLKSGKVDLIIGTHRLLSKDVIYKDLGLLVVDEEQRFGVTHKEKIKKYQENIDILTLSATPIPRTLQMSLTGVRGLSLIETPPVDRYPIQTYVLRENDQVLKDAIYKELARSGQVFALYNNVSKIERQVSRIKRLVPEAEVTYIHGQMNKNQIEETMEQFVLKKYNVLVCTTIIETGIDIQNANTLIVFDSDHFGLSQLYQIRGRIGRGNNIGYAYLMYNAKKELNDVATKRLNAIKEFTELGSGYALAVRDLSIRGAGDILGSQQSGFIDSIGYDMYLKILNEEVDKLKGHSVVLEDDEIVEAKPFIQVATHIGSEYADNEELKIEIHKMINKIDSYNEFIKVKKELEDRFGSLSEEIVIYMLEELFQSSARKKGVKKVEQLQNKIVIYFEPNISTGINGAILLTKLFKITPNFSVQYINKILKVTLSTINLEKNFIYYLVEMINIIE